jgi:hypothetical protein
MIQFILYFLGLYLLISIGLSSSLLAINGNNWFLNKYKEVIPVPDYIFYWSWIPIFNFLLVPSTIFLLGDYIFTHLWIYFHIIFIKESHKDLNKDFNKDGDY